MKLTDKITKHLMSWCNSGNDIVLPNFYVGIYECDVLRITRADVAYEYEIKISRADFFADFKKCFGSVKKHDRIANGERINRFYFVVPEDMVTKEEVPAHCGLVYFHAKKTQWGEACTLSVVKIAPILHKNPFNTNGLARSMYYRERSVRSKLHELKRESKAVIDLKRRNQSLERENNEIRDLLLACEGNRFGKMIRESSKYKKLFTEDYN